MVSLLEAYQIIEKNIGNEDTEFITIDNALSRVVSEDIYAEYDIAPFDYSKFDGYAVFSEDIRNFPVELKIVDNVYAGDICKTSFQSGQTVKITTGTIIPNGCDAVVKFEDICVVEDRIIINNYIKKNDGIGFKGCVIKKGEIIIKKNQKVTSKEIELMAMSGVSKVVVFKHIGVSVLNTGSELIEIDEELVAGKIFSSNGYYLKAKLSEMDIVVLEKRISKDSKGLICKNMLELFNKTDFVITTGGIGRGEKDLIKSCIEQIGFKILIDYVDVRPGGSVILSVKKDKLILSLSGNTFAMKNAFNLIGTKVISKIYHREDLSNE